MNSRIGAARPLGQYFFSCDSSNDRGKCALHRGRIGLHLPAGEFSAVIGESHFEIAHRVIFRVQPSVRIIQAISGSLWQLQNLRASAMYQFGKGRVDRKAALKSDILTGFRGNLPRCSQSQCETKF